MQEFNIVELIESNPITKLTNTYNVKLLDKIKTHFSNFEQQLFISSFYCYLKYDKNNDFVVDLDNIWEWLGFQQKYHAKTVLEKHFKPDIDYKKFASEVAEAKSLLLDSQEQKNNSNNNKNKQKKGSGGHNKETILLTIKCFKSLCLKSQTKKAGEIHEYYMKMEEVLQEIIEEESTELKQQLENVKTEITQIEKTHQKEFDKKVALDREQFLLREFGAIGSVIYIIKVKSYNTGEYVIKIGESRKGVQLRYNEHKSKYNEALLLDCFAVKKSKEFENFLHNHEQIKFSRVTDLSGHENERELFLIGKKLIYRTLLHIIHMNIKHFNEYNESDIEKLKAENETLKGLIQPNQTTTCQNTNPINNNELLTKILNKIEHLEKSNKEILEKLNAQQTKTTTNFNQPLVTLGPRLQQINPETMLLNKVYDSIAECIKEYNFKVKRPSIVKAIEENTIYHGYRWAYVDRNVDPNIIVNIQVTKPTRVQHVGYIAKLNKEKTEILNVYLDRKSACSCENYKSTSVLDTPVKNETLYNGFYYILYDECEEEIINKFVEKYGPPLLYKNGIGQYDETNTLVNEFICKYDCIKQLKISDKTLAKALDNNIPYNNTYFKSIGNKIKCL